MIYILALPAILRNNVCFVSVHGGWGDWSDWSECSVTCGGGTRTRARRCDSPSPNDFGESCTGDDTGTGDCNTDNCPVCGSAPQPYGTELDCIQNGALTVCDINCRSGLIRTKEHPLALHCGFETLHVWQPDFDIEDLPSCSGNN